MAPTTLTAVSAADTAAPVVSTATKMLAPVTNTVAPVVKTAVATLAPVTGVVVPTVTKLAV